MENWELFTRTQPKHKRLYFHKYQNVSKNELIEGNLTEEDIQMHFLRHPGVWFITALGEELAKARAFFPKSKRLEAAALRITARLLQSTVPRSDPPASGLAAPPSPQRPPPVCLVRQSYAFVSFSSPFFVYSFNYKDHPQDVRAVVG